MSYFKQPVITTKATQELTTLLTQNSTLTFTRIVLGSGRHRTGIESKTDVDHSVHVLQANYAPLTTESNTYRILARLDNAQVESELQVNEIGVFAKRNGGEEFLFMYTWAETGDVIPPKSQGSVIRDYEFNTTISKDAQVTVTYESGSHTYAQLSELKQVEDKIEELKSASSESAAVAERLASAREIALSGEASGRTTFDGSQNANINVIVQKASTSKRGIVQLSSALDSASETEAATSKALKELHDMHKQDARALSDHISDRTAHVTSEEKRIWSEKANASHGHSISDISGLQQALTTKANTNSVQTHRLTKDNSQALDASGDWNNYSDTGFYKGNNLANRPHGANFFYVQVIKDSDRYSVQQAWDADGTISAFRVKHDGTWRPWHKITYDISVSAFPVTLINGARASEQATQEDNKFYVIGNLVALKLRIDTRNLGGYSISHAFTIIPSELVPKRLKNQSRYSGWGRSNGNMISAGFDRGMYPSEILYMSDDGSREVKIHNYDTKDFGAKGKPDVQMFAIWEI